VTPVPATLPLADVRRINAVRERLCYALRVANTLSGLRTYVAALASDLEAAVTPPDEHAPDTVRTYTAPWDGDAAPPTPRASALGEEYGV
jgi:hypothetical protein